MEKDAKEALQVTKEIVVKFIETSRVSPTSFAEVFPAVYRVVLDTISGASPKNVPGSDARESGKGQGA